MARLSNDTIRSMTDMTNVITEARVQGRGFSEWVILLVCYLLAVLASSVFDKLSGADKILDQLLGSEPSSDTWSTTFFYAGIAFITVMLLSALQWAILPRIAGWFGGSRLRRDASIAYYFFFCLGIVFSLVFIPVSLIAVGLQSILPPFGTYFWLVGLSAILGLWTHFGTQAAREAQNFASYRSALLAVFVSLFLALAALLIVLFAVVFAVEIIAPNWLEGWQ
jgi:hypothetical protein